MTHALTDAEIARYRRNGFLCPIPVLDPAEVAVSRAALEGAESRLDGTLPRPIHEYLRSGAGIAAETPLEVARDPRVLDRVESLLGPDLLIWSCEYFIKEPRTDKIVSWHQDLTYWGMDGTDHEVTAWVALSPATPASGCMRFVPGSHTQAIVPHEDKFAEDNLLSRGQEIAVEVDEAESVPAALRPGEMSLHHGRLFHASGPNGTDDRRIGLVIRYIRPDTPTVRAGSDYAMLARGADRTRNRINLMPPPGDFTPARLALWEEVAAAQASVLAEGLETEDDLYKSTPEVSHA
ncbi:MAG: phytanoyl-CoA dioxygenase family protein [Pseudomonadota bacterium]